MKINIKNIEISNKSPITIIAGINVFEDLDMAEKVASELKKITSKLDLPFIFKASFDKANRSSVESYRGPGLEEGIKIFNEIKVALSVPVITDVHEIEQVEKISEVADIIQIPAFLCRQTDLIRAACETKLPLNIKKGQFLSPGQMLNIIDKCHSFNNENIMLCERGSSFGYNNLVSDFRSLEIMKKSGYPVIFDATHSVQEPGGLGDRSGGKKEFIPVLSRAAIAVGIAGLFIETHDDPDNAPSDGPNMVPLKELKSLLKKLTEIDKLIK